MKKIVLYTRVSSDKKEQQNSLKSQREQYEEYCKRKNYELIEIYAEIGSATSVRQRPKFIQMMADAGLNYEINNEGTDIFKTSKREPKIDLIIVKDASRFSRSLEIGMNTVNRLRDKGVFVIFENAGVTSSDDNANFVLPLLFTIAENESENLSKRVKFTKNFNAKEGNYRPARLPYGYMRNELNQIVIHPDEVEVVKFIYEQYKDVGSHILTRRLNEKQIPTQRSNKWSNDKITRIISNRIYTGTAMVGRSKKTSVTDTKRTDVDEKEWIPIPNAVPAIVTLEEYEAANKIRESRVNKSTKKGRKPSVNDIYHGKLSCQNCGSRFVRHVGVKDKITYICQNRRKGLGCEVRGISINNVNEVFDRVGVSNLMDGMSNHAGYNQLLQRIEAEANNLESRRNTITADIKQLETSNKKLTDAIETEIVTGQAAIEGLSEKMETNKRKIIEQEALKDKINISSIIKLKDKVESKKQLIDGIRFGKGINKEEKLELLKEIVIGDYECTTSFSFPNFEDEILEFNTIFPMSEIESVKVYHFTETIRRTHKAAREYWDGLDNSRIDHEDYYSYNHNPEDNHLMGGGNYFGRGKNVGKEALEMEKLLEESSNS